MRIARLIVAAAALAASGVVAANASSPAQDRRQLQAFYHKKFPKIKLDNYVYGALIFSPDAMEQYREMMQMPPGEEQMDRGKKLWSTPLTDGTTYAQCLPHGGKDIAGDYPYFDDKRHEVVTLEMALNRCRVEHGDKKYVYSDMKTMGALDLYARRLSRGMKINIKVRGPGARAAYEKGRWFFYSRRGQLNFACATCHVDNAGKHVRNEFLSPVIGQAAHWPVLRGAGTLFTLQKRYAACQKMVRAAPFKLGGTEYNDLEYFHMYMSNGLPLQAGVWRK